MSPECLWEAVNGDGGSFTFGQKARGAQRAHFVEVVVDFEKIEGTSQEWILEHVRAGRQGVSAEIVRAGFAMDRQMHVDGMTENYMLQFRRP